MRRSVLLALIATLLLGAAPAVAHRHANRREATAIRIVVRAYIHKRHSPAPKDARIGAITISTANHSYGLVGLRSHKAGPAKLLVHTLHGKWRVIAFATGAFGCSRAPAKVFKDLFGSAGACLPGGY